MMKLNYKTTSAYLSGLDTCVNKIVDFQAGKSDFKTIFKLKSLGQISALKLRPPKPKPKAKKHRSTTAVSHIHL